MTDEAGSQDRSEIYEVRVRGHISLDWTDWFGGLEIVQQLDGTTILRGALPDQAALHGLLVTIRDLGLPIISVIQVTSERDQHH